MSDAKPQDVPGQVQDPNAPPPAYQPPVQGQPLQPAYPQQPAGSYPPPQQQYPPPPPGQQTTVVVTHQPGAAPGYPNSALCRYGDHPVAIQCSVCTAQGSTMTTKEKGTMVWLMIGIICLLGFWAGCCLIPLCIPSLHDTVHQCPNCKAVVGKCSKM